VTAGGGAACHTRAVRLIPVIILSMALGPACDVEADRVEPREAEDGCAYSAPLNYNDDHANTPAECTMKLALCVDSFLVGCDEDAPGCYSEIGHCFKKLDVCWKTIG